MLTPCNNNFSFFSATGLILKYVNKGFSEIQAAYADDGLPSDQKALYTYLEAVHAVKQGKDEQAVARLVEQHQLSKEHVPTVLINSKEVRVFSPFVEFPFYVLTYFGLEPGLPRQIFVWFHNSWQVFSNMASDWPTGFLPANPLPCSKILFNWHEF